MPIHSDLRDHLVPDLNEVEIFQYESLCHRLHATLADNGILARSVS